MQASFSKKTQRSIFAFVRIVGGDLLFGLPLLGGKIGVEESNGESIFALFVILGLLKN